MAVQARLAPLPASNRRYSPRRTLKLHSTLGDGGEHVIIHDMSHTGLLLETDAPLAERQSIDVELPEAGVVRASVVWRSARYVGCKFAVPVSQAAVSAALLRNPIDGRESHSNIRAWEELGKSVADPKPAQGLSFGTKLRAILVISMVLWGAVFWTLGIF